MLARLRKRWKRVPVLWKSFILLHLFVFLALFLTVGTVSYARHKIVEAIYACESEPFAEQRAQSMEFQGITFDVLDHWPYFCPVVWFDVEKGNDLLFGWPRGEDIVPRCGMEISDGRPDLLDSVRLGTTGQEEFFHRPWNPFLLQPK